MSIYDPIWEKLKAAKTVSLVADRKLHPRIVKAVKKRKYLDLAYKINTEPLVPVLSHTRNGNTLTFFLTLTSPVRLTYSTSGEILL